jgi:hypothetical protein
VRISCLIADAPARAFVKGIKNHNAYHGCERCVDEGEWVSRVVHLNLNAAKRSDLDFSQRSDTDHHVYHSPLSNLNFGLVSQVGLDYMHLICLGVVRKLLHLWIAGPLPTRLPKKIKDLSEFLVNIRNTVPTEFARKQRSLKDLSRFKATEFRQFLLYIGPGALKGIIPDKHFQHFLQLQAATFILLSEKANMPFFNNLAKELFRKFVVGMIKMYGKSTAVYNVHSLIHINDDALLFGNLDKISAFPFENYLQTLKKMVRGQKLQIEQIAKRVTEMESLDIQQNYVKKLCSHIIIRKGSCRKIIVNNFVVSSKEGDNCFLVKGGKIILITKIAVTDTNCPQLFCKEVFFKKSLKLYPVNSKQLGICVVTSRTGRTKQISVNDLCRKVVRIPIYGKKDKYICIPMLHSLK